MERLNRADFDAVYRLMELSFPPEERRTRDGQQALLSDERYRLWGERCGGRLVGLAAVWELQPAAFIEHLAVEPDCRSSGIGGRMLDALIREYGALCLEVELPETPLAARRIAFYRRHGFECCTYPYRQPPLSPGSAAVPLRIMTRGYPLTEARFCALRDQLYRQVYQFSETP